MGDMGDLYRDWDAIKKERKAERLAEAEAANMPGWTRHTPYHWSRDLQGDRMDYWPSTGKWRWRNRNHRGTVGDMIGFVRNRAAPCPVCREGGG